MKGARNTGFVVSLALLATLVGHIAIQRHFERESRSRGNFVDSSTAFTLKPPGFDISSEKPGSEGFRIPRPLDRSRRVTPALGVQEEKEHDSGHQSNRPPAEVPAPTDAISAEDSSHAHTNVGDEDSAAVRDVIEHELSHATREEREIWFDELKTLPAGVVRDLLQVRKQLRALPRVLGGIPEKLASADPLLLNRPHEVPAEPASQKIRFNLPDQIASTSALESAISQLRHNVTNAATPGFKRIRITLIDAYSSPNRHSEEVDESRSEQSVGVCIQGEGCRMASPLLDLKQGILKKTARQFDLAIDGEGFFVIRRGEKEFLTRCGAFTLDRDRHLCLAITNDIVLLQPLLTIPEDAREIQISAQGVVTALKSGETTLNPIGEIKLARVASPARLQPTGNTLFGANENSGAIVVGAPMSNGLGEIQQGFLETSNVEFEQELAEIEELTTILNSLPPHNSRPATANAQQSLQKR
jgi:flagellar basal-body rod protein FlgG